MKKIFYIAFAAAALAAVSCAKTAEFDAVKPDGSAQGLTLRFSTGDMVTRATDGVGKEDLIKRIDYFIFPLNVDEDGEMIGTTEYVYKGSLTPEDDGLAGEYEAVFAPGILSEIFPNGATKAMVFAVANYVDKFGAAVESPNMTIPADSTTWRSLHNLEVGETFFKDGGPGYGLRWPRVMQPNEYTVSTEVTTVDEDGNEVTETQTETQTDDLFFVMTGEAEVELVTTGSYAVDAEIPLKRLASKVTVSFTYEPVVEEKTSGNIYWVPQPGDEETRVYLSNAIEHTTLGGPLTRDLVADSWGTATKPLGDGTRDIFEYSYDYMNDIAADESGNKVAHYYTYPIQMEEGDDNQSYLKLVLPWYGYKWIGEGTAPDTVDPESSSWQMYKQKEVYYKIVLPSATINEGNRIYEYDVTVNIVGSDKEVKIIGEEYIVKDWLTKAPVSSNVATGRYISLDIPKDEYDMYVDEIDIAFVSSGTVIPIVKEIYQLNYSSATTSRDYFMQDDVVTATNALKTAKGITNADIEGWVTIPDETSYLKINHAMDNNMLNAAGTGKNNAFDMAPYVFVVTLHLEAAGDDTSFDRTVTITQYPSLYVTSKRSNGYAYVNNYSNQRGNSYSGYGDSNRGCEDDAGNNLGDFSYRYDDTMGSGDNRNPNNYIITTTMLSDELKVQIGTGNNSQTEATILGDPRKTSVDNLSNLALSNYKPTDPDGSRTVIAPKLLIASSYGVMSSRYWFDLDSAEKRCAAYQENGYPAGRWRVPTLAEITFMITLSNMGFIPSLFNLSENDLEGYWCANGKVSGDANALPYLSTDTQETAVRCVYDAWYWGEEPYQEGATTWLGYHD